MECKSRKGASLAPQKAQPMKKFLAALFLLFLCAPSLAQQSDGGASVLQVRGSTWPGAVLFVSINAPQETTGTWKWAGRSGKLTKAPYGLRTGLAVPLDASEGGQATLKIDLTHADGTEESLERKLTIDKKWRPVQYLSMSSDNEAKYTDPKADEEEVKVFDALEDLQPGLRWKGNFVDPSPAPRSSPFGVRRIRNGRTAGFHRGLDYAGSVGSPIYAPADGKVTLVGPNYTLLGNWVKGSPVSTCTCTPSKLKTGKW